MGLTSRRFGRLIQFGLLLLLCSSDYLWRAARSRGNLTLQDRSQWLHRWARRVSRCLRLHSSYTGAIDSGGTMLVANHLGYLDILVIASHRPVVFVSKAEVRHWPVLGWLTAKAGTLYLDRKRRTAIGGAAGTLCHLLAQGFVVVVFPEGTSTDGRQVLPFRSSLFAAPLEAGSSVTPAALTYALHSNGSDGAMDVAYWGDMTFGIHFWRLLGCDRIEAACRFGLPIRRGVDRKALALEAWEQVSALMSGLKSPSSVVRTPGVVRPMGTTHAYEPDPT